MPNNGECFIVNLRDMESGYIKSFILDSRIYDVNAVRLHEIYEFWNDAQHVFDFDISEYERDVSTFRILDDELTKLQNQSLGHLVFISKGCREEFIA